MAIFNSYVSLPEGMQYDAVMLMQEKSFGNVFYGILLAKLRWFFNVFHGFFR
jgi:hypothetical protein